MTDLHSDEKPFAPPGTIFATTHWSVVLQAGGLASSQSSVALEKLCRTYWSPIYAFLRRQGHKEEDAKDLTQGFFEQLLERGDFQRVEAGVVTSWFLLHEAA